MSHFSEGPNEGWLYPDDVQHKGLKEFLNSLDAVTPVKSRAEGFRASWTARCPAHDDANPSLSVRWAENGRINVKCFANCKREDVLRAAGVDASLVAAPRPSGGGRKPEAVYPYRDQAGKLLFEVCRFPGKVIRFRRPNGRGGWVWNAGKKRVPYRLADIIAARSAGQAIFVCEGEKDADRLASLGLFATCNPGGAERWRSEYTPYFVDLQTILLQDNDEAGERHVTAVAKALAGHAKSVRVLLLPGLPPKGDVSDWLDAGHTLQELLAAAESAPLVPATREEIAEPDDDADLRRYAESKNGLYRLRGPDEAPVRLANFIARITRQIVEDDGVEQKTTFELTVTRSGKVKVIRLSAAMFDEMKWPSAHVGALAALTPMANPREVAYVIKLQSRGLKETILYTHTGWRLLENGTWAYLHGGGAIGPAGPIPDVDVRLDGQLSAAVLPSTPSGQELVALLREVLELLRLAPARVIIPLIAGVFRSPFGHAGFSIHLFGETGAGKTPLAALMQQFFGKGFDWSCLPSNWSSTANAIEMVLFHAKDMLAVVDDFNPRGAIADVQRLHQTADRVFRGAANVSARGRLNRESSLRSVKPPRGILLSTGEEPPTGHSLAARILLVEVMKDEVDFAALKIAQDRGRDGRLAAVMSAFLQFHAVDFESISSTQAKEIVELRSRFTRDGQHRRLPDAVANGMWGWIRFLKFAESCGAIDGAERTRFEVAGWTAFRELADAQRTYQPQENPARLFMVLIDSAVQGELAHLTEFDGRRPTGGVACGWRREPMKDGDEIFRPMGARIGFIDKDYVYLVPTIAMRIAQDASRGGPHSIPVAEKTLAKRLLSERLLLSHEVRDGKNYNTQRKTTADGRTPLWIFHRNAFAFASAVEGDPPGSSYEM